MVRFVLTGVLGRGDARAAFLAVAFSTDGPQGWVKEIRRFGVSAVVLSYQGAARPAGKSLVAPTTALWGGSGGGVYSPPRLVGDGASTKRKPRPGVLGWVGMLFDFFRYVGCGLLAPLKPVLTLCAHA